MIKRFCLLVCLVFHGWLAAQTCAIPGITGPSTASGVLNSYHAGSGSPASGASSITIASATGQRTSARQLQVGDLVLIMQMQDSTAPANAGNYEYAQIASITGTTLGLTRPLVNGYFQTMNTTNVRNWQLIYVPQYSSLTISGSVNADRFTINNTTGAATGGVVAIDVAGSMTLTGTITVAGAGFRGGAGLNGTGNRAGGAYTDADYNMTTTAANLNGGLKGEGIEGTPFQVFDGTATPVSYLTLLGQGYTLGAGGRAAKSNAGGAGNDGEPVASGNQYNSGGGGGSNAGAGGRGGNAWNNNTTGGALNQPLGGNTGNAAGGLGGNALTNSATRLVMGGGGGSGSANDAAKAANTVTTWPPATSTVANGAANAISISGASGGGVIMVRAGSMAGTGLMDADGYHAYNSGGGGGAVDGDGTGGGGAGGSIFVTAASGNGTGLTLQARGGWGGRSSFYNHGPGGGAGGGYILTNLTAATTNVIPGQNGLDACCGGGAGNGSPKAYNALPGNTGTAVTTGGTASGVSSGATCLPNLTVSKSTSTPLVSATGATTVGYTISVSNAGGAAIGADLIDSTLPPGWTWASTSSVTFAPPLSATAYGGFVESATPGSPAVANSPGGVANLSVNGVPAAAPIWSNLSIPAVNNGVPGRATLTFVANVPSTATVGCYHNPAGVKYIDPTRSTAGREITPVANNTANRAGAQVGGTANTTYETTAGTVTTVAGSNYSGLATGSSAEDVCLQGDLSLTKTVTPTAVIAGNTITYTLVASNAGRTITGIDYATNQATTATINDFLLAGNLRVIDTLPTGVTVVNAFAGTGWSCSQVGLSLTCDRTPTVTTLVGTSVIGTITGGVLTTAGVCPGPVNNTATVVALLSPYTETTVVNNTGTSAAVSTTCSANLSVTKTNTVTSLVAGGTTVYAITFDNAGPSDAGGAVVRDTPSAGLSACIVTACTATGGNPAASCPAAGNWPNIFTGSGLSLPSFPAGASIRFTVSCNVTATGT